LWLSRLLGLFSFADVCAWGATCRGWRELARAEPVWRQLREREFSAHRFCAGEARMVLAYATAEEPRGSMDDVLFVASRFSPPVFCDQFASVEGVLSGRLSQSHSITHADVLSLSEPTAGLPQTKVCSSCS
jgi:hypothetical protein